MSIINFYKVPFLTRGNGFAINYKTKESRTAYLNQYRILYHDDVDIKQKNDYGKSILIALDYESSEEINYVNIDDKFYYVDSVSYQNLNTTYLNISLDILATYHFDYKISKCLVNRMHRDTTLPLLDSIPEQLKTGSTMEVRDVPLKKSSSKYQEINKWIVYDNENMIKITGFALVKVLKRRTNNESPPKYKSDYTLDEGETTGLITILLPIFETDMDRNYYYHFNGTEIGYFSKITPYHSNDYGTIDINGNMGWVIYDFGEGNIVSIQYLKENLFFDKIEFDGERAGDIPVLKFTTPEDDDETIYYDIGLETETAFDYFYIKERRNTSKLSIDNPGMLKVYKHYDLHYKSYGDIYEPKIRNSQFNKLLVSCGGSSLVIKQEHLVKDSELLIQYIPSLTDTNNSLIRLMNYEPYGEDSLTSENVIVCNNVYTLPLQSSNYVTFLRDNKNSLVARRETIMDNYKMGLLNTGISGINAAIDTGTTAAMGGLAPGTVGGQQMSLQAGATGAKGALNTLGSLANLHNNKKIETRALNALIDDAAWKPNSILSGNDSEFFNIINGGNTVRLREYFPNTVHEARINNFLKRYGETVNQYLNGSELFTRDNHNYIQLSDIIFDYTNTKLTSGILNAIEVLYNGGITFFEEDGTIDYLAENNNKGV